MLCETRVISPSDQEQGRYSLLPLLLVTIPVALDDIIINNEKYTKGMSIWMEELTLFSENFFKQRENPK